MDTDRAAADLVAVADDVVGPGQGVAGVAVSKVVEDSGVLRRGEGVVHGRPGAVADRDVAGGGGVGGGLEQRRVDDPEEAPGALVDQAAAATDLEARGAEQRAAGLDRAGGEEDAVARLRRPTWAARPAFSSSVRFLATGPPSSPSSWTST